MTSQEKPLTTQNLGHFFQHAVNYAKLHAQNRCEVDSTPENKAALAMLESLALGVDAAARAQVAIAGSPVTERLKR